MTLNRICILNILIPPVVDPVQPPTSIKINNKPIANPPHLEKFSVE